ncbi:MAG: thioredoxin family protein [Thermodesulfobacteriota bacterium]
MKSKLSLIAASGIIVLMLSYSAHAETEIQDDESRQTPGSHSSADESNIYDLAGSQSGFDKIEVISRGTLIDLIEHLVPGKYTAFYFYADWCRPCRVLKPKLEDFVESGEKLALREIDIINWENPLVMYYKLPSIPYFIIYGPDGEFLERGPGISNEVMREVSAPD